MQMSRRMADGNDDDVIFWSRCQKSCPRLVASLREYIKKDVNEKEIHLKFQKSCPRLVASLREYIKKDVNEKEIHLKHYSKYQIALPPLHTFSEEFRLGFEEAVIDRDVKNDLERSGVINWCRMAKPLLPLKTTADGNCLLHAVSQALWGIEDDDNFLRRLVYASISIDLGEHYKRRWIFHQRSLLQSATADFRLNTDEHNLEWDNVIRATDDTRSPEAHGLPYKMLEAIHLFAIANILKRPIILVAETVARNIYGQAVQDNHIGGIYLPLHIDPKNCIKSPLVIAYSLNHFTPLVFQTDGPTTRNEMAAVPLVSKDFCMQAIKFLLPDEETAQPQELLGRYLVLKEVVYDAVPIPVAAMKEFPLPQAVNVVDDYTKVCERKFQQLFVQEAAPARNDVMPNQNKPGLHRFTLPINAENQAQGRDQECAENEKCCTVNCEQFTEPGMHGLCASCFQDFTVQYAKQEEAKRQILQGQPPIQPGFQRYEPNMPQQRQHPSQANRQSGPEFYDLSMMGEDCQAKCGFKCATETYPYCHECYPKYVTEPARQAAARSDTQLLQQQELSMLPDQCVTMGCTFLCSKATAPYCHQCFDRNRLPGKFAPTAPPPSIPTIPQHPSSPSNTPNAGVPQLTQYQPGPHMRPFQTENKDETAVVSLRDRTYLPSPVGPQKSPSGMTMSGHSPQHMTQAIGGHPNIQVSHKKCLTMNCQGLAEKGNNGYCDNCYQLTLFGNNLPVSPTYSGSSCGSVCSTLNCTNLVQIPAKKQCNECFLHARPIAQSPGPQLLPWTGGSPSDPVGFNITQPEDVPKILNLPHGRLPIQAEMTRQATDQHYRSIPSEHDETHELATSAVGLQIQKHAKYDSSTRQKYICATPGCHGIRTEPSGQCLSCQQGNGPHILQGSENIEHHQEATGQQESGNMMNSDPFISESPVPLTKDEIRKINPVVLSSKDKTKCSYKGCSNLIYPPKTLCDTCTADLDRVRSEHSRHESKELAKLEGGNQPCRTPGCQFFGTRQNDGYCSSCLRGKGPLTGGRHSTEPITKVEIQQAERSHSAPVSAVSPQIIATPSPRTPQPMAAPITSSGSQRRGFQCITEGCSKFGDPYTEYRCTQHFLEMRNGPKLSQESIAQLQRKIYPYPANDYQGQPPMNGQNFGMHGNTVGVVTANFPPQGQNVQAFPPQQTTHTQTVPSDQFNHMYQRVETAKKSKARCKNNGLIGCPNWGNSSKKGYCNDCYENLKHIHATR